MCGREWVSRVLLFPCSSELQSSHVSQAGVVYCKLIWSQGDLYSPLTWSLDVSQNLFYKNLINFILSDFMPIACLPACVDAQFHHATLGGLWRMWSLSGADFSSQRRCSSQERGCILTATCDVTNPLPVPWLSSLLWLPCPTALGAALLQEGNYLSTPITSMPAIFLTSAPDESPLPTVEKVLDQFREWSRAITAPVSACGVQHALLAIKLSHAKS